MHCKAAFALTLLPALLGCPAEVHKPVHTIMLLDISKSIYDDGIEQEFGEAQQIAQSVNRGDMLTLIPILGNARNDTPGHIIRLSAPTTRAPFDADLVGFRRGATATILDFKSWALVHRDQRTDILGALKLADEEMGTTRAENTRLIVLSDFLEDDGQTNFINEIRLRSVSGAMNFAASLRARFSSRLAMASISTQRLHSSDVSVLDQSRMDAIDAFWETLFMKHGLKPQMFAKPAGAVEP